MRPSASPLLNPSGLVDQRLQPMWEQIEQVRLLLPQIAHVSYYMESIFNLDRNLTLLTDENVDHSILKDIQIFQGANAYEIAVAEGFVGTVSEWLTSLVGPKGDTGLLNNIAHQVLTDGIAANAAAALAAQNTANTAISTFSDYTPKTTYDARVAYVDGVLANLNTTINDAIIPLLPAVRTDLEITTLANTAITNALLVVNSAIDVLGSRVDLHDIDLGNISSDLSDVSTAFGSFLIDNGDTLSRIDVLEASSSSYNSSIISLQTVSADYAADITVLQSASATSNSQILALQAVDASTATQVNNLQVSNNANFASIESLETVTVDGLAAAALDRTTIRAEFATADDDVLTSATALVEDETTARTTALGAAATDRAAIRTEFATADDGVLTAASALVSSEASARSDADGAAAIDRGAIRAEFAIADDGVLTAATALVTDEASTRATAVSAVATSVSTLSSTVGGLSATVTAQGLTLADIEGNLVAKYAISVDGGGNGSLISLEDGTESESIIKLAADTIEVRADALDLGSATTFEASHDTFYTISGSYRYRYGGPFGASSDLLQWFGLNSVALNTETKTNGVFAMATDGKVYFGTSPAGALTGVSPDSPYVFGFGAAIPVGTAVTNGGTGPFTWSWVKLSGDDPALTYSTTSSPVINTLSGSGVILVTVTDTSDGKTAQASVGWGNVPV